MDQLVAQLVRDEGEKLLAYKDSKGVLTIGVGHSLNNPITQTASRQILNDDIIRSDTELYKEIPWTETLDDARKGVFRNLAFNMGVNGLLSFKHFLNYANYSLWDKAAAELLNSTWATEVGDRAERLAKQLITGVWQ